MNRNVRKNDSIRHTRSLQTLTYPYRLIRNDIFHVTHFEEPHFNWNLKKWPLWSLHGTQSYAARVDSQLKRALKSCNTPHTPRMVILQILSVREPYSPPHSSLMDSTSSLTNGDEKKIEIENYDLTEAI